MSTVLIVGAGASKDFHPEMRIGSELSEDILNRVIEFHLPKSERYMSNILQVIIDKKFKTDYKELNELADLWKKRDFFLDFHRDFWTYLEKQKKKNQTGSIDDFLNNPICKEKYLQLGKFVVGFHIMGYEGAGFKHYVNTDTWLYHFASKLELIIDNGKNIKDLNIVTFNYDRLIEDYLHFYFKQRNKWNQVLENLLTNQIIHVYGSLGNLPWQNNGVIDFGMPNNLPENMVKVMKNFRLISEERYSEKRNKDIKSWINNADKIYFLGFGFLTENMKAISWIDNKENVSINLKNKIVKATVYNPTLKFINQVEPYIGENNWRKCTCSQFIRNDEVFQIQ